MTGMAGTEIPPTVHSYYVPFHVLRSGKGHATEVPGTDLKLVGRWGNLARQGSILFVPGAGPRRRPFQGGFRHASIPIISPGAIAEKGHVGPQGVS